MFDLDDNGPDEVASSCPVCAERELHDVEWVVGAAREVSGCGEGTDCPVE